MEAKIRKVCTYNIQTENYTIREETLNGKPHMVVPVVMMVEGVHEGSNGPICHKAENMAQSAEAWNGVPVTISHPTIEENGKKIFVTANSPEVLNTITVGHIFNTIYQGGLKAEAWIDEESISTISPDALEHIRSGDPLDVSIGVFSETDDTEGEWHGEIFTSTAITYQPDHLALLPGEVGACSWDDGCGIRVNKKGGSMKDLFKTFKQLSQEGYVVSILNNEQGYRAIQSALQDKLQDLNTGDSYHYIEEVFDDYIVYSKWVDGSGETLYKQSYTRDNEENIVFDGLASEVRKDVQYITLRKVRRTKPNINSNNKGGKMNDSKSLCCEDKVDRLIANKQTHWSASDREWLLEQDEGTIAKMSPMEPEKAEQSADEIQANKDQVIADYNAGKKSIDDYTKGMPDVMKAEVEGGVKLYKKHRETLVKGIMDNAKDVWEMETLEAMDDDTLENVSKSITKPVDYSAQGAGGNGVAVDGEEAVEIPVEHSRDGREDK